MAKKAATMTDTQFKAFLKDVGKGNHPERNTTILIFSFKLGLRAKELSELTVDNVIDCNDRVRDVLELTPEHTKGGKHRAVPLSSPLVRKTINNWIEYRKNNDGALFSHKAPLFRSQKGVAFSANSMAHMIRNLFQKNGKQGFSSHSGRRTMITKMVNNGVSLNKVKTIAGHSSIATTMEYVDTNPDDLANVMKLMG